ncbi:MAG: hypothetical protein ACRESY_11055, partial [Steroidobacteraceae bacterium]
GHPNAMLDVHSPHGAARTWTDFWIHLGTISIGLLIAIGLEQSAEALHRLHQRHRLEQDLQLEAKKNLVLMEIDNRYFDATLPWLIQLRNKVDEVRESGGKVKFDYLPAPRTDGLFWPDSPYWNTAKQSAEVGLLPRDEAGMYDLVYTQQGVMKDRYDGYANVIDEIRRFESRFANLKIGAAATDGDVAVGNIWNDTPIPDISRITSEDLREYSILLNAAVTELSRFHRYTTLAYAVTHAATQGAHSDEQLFKLMGARPGDDSSPQKSAAH